MFRSGKLPHQESMLIFHALARLGMESLVVVSPLAPIASVGYFQDIAIVDLDYCARRSIALMRREVGGGLTYLDENQIFYQVVVKKDNPMVCRNIEALYRKFSEPPINTYAEFGIPTRFKPINDIITEKGKKIAGEGAADIGDCLVFVGGILLDFDYDTMSHLFRVESESHRATIARTLRENLTTMRDELGRIPEREEVERSLIRHFSRVLPSLQRAEIDDEIRQAIEKTSKEIDTPDFLNRGKSKGGGQIKIASGTEFLKGSRKAAGGMIHTLLELREGKIRAAHISGDFTFYPRESLRDLETRLIGAEPSREKVRSLVEDFYREAQAESPGISAQDLLEAFFLERKNI